MNITSYKTLWQHEVPAQIPQSVRHFETRNHFRIRRDFKLQFSFVVEQKTRLSNIRSVLQKAKLMSCCSFWFYAIILLLVV